MLAHLNGGCAGGAISRLQRGEDGRLPCVPSGGLAVQGPRPRTRGQQGPAQRDPRGGRRRSHGLGGGPNERLGRPSPPPTHPTQAADIVSRQKPGPPGAAAQRPPPDGPRPTAAQARVGRRQWRQRSPLRMRLRPRGRRLQRWHLCAPFGRSHQDRMVVSRSACCQSLASWWRTGGAVQHALRRGNHGGGQARPQAVVGRLPHKERKQLEPGGEICLSSGCCGLCLHCRDHGRVQGAHGASHAERQRHERRLGRSTGRQPRTPRPIHSLLSMCQRGDTTR